MTEEVPTSTQISSFENLLAGQAPEWPEALLAKIRERLWSSGDRLVVLDDDPTGTQTVSGVEVLMDWSQETISRALRTSRVFFILTNSRSLGEPEAVEVNREIGARVVAALRPGMRLRLASRSDSTLRGHFPAEVEALVEGAGLRVKATLLVPSFPEGGRFTLNDVHWAKVGSEVVPVAETAYARDPVFRYTQSWLPGWVENKSGGRVRASDVASLGLALIRQLGPNGVANALRRLPDGSVAVVNAVSERDLEVVANGVQLAEAEGLDFVYRTAASFVRSRGGIEQRPLLSRRQVFRNAPTDEGHGVVICGSHVPLSTAQVAAACSLPDVVCIEVKVDDLHRSGPAGNGAVLAAARKASAALEGRKHALVYTTREYRQLDAAHPLSASGSVARALADVVSHLTCRPAFVVGKGGITSSVLATQGLRMKTARVMGQVAPGISVWSSHGGRLPRVPYVVFPGNVGGGSTLADLLNFLG